MLVSGTTAAKSYVVQHTLPNGKPRRMTIGPTNVKPLDTARAEAKDLLERI